uniref:GIY-YIG endonuclease n=1 Tax=Chrysoporthe austroafricana TaxID=354353 RepID=A0A191MWU7_9PEZI|nr:GIY-YIG endonuclease [Chrysoporthe austroafricana]AMX22079.1 GIY-YIG endonuclease [Chrysoporthe austroafricana]
MKLTRNEPLKFDELPLSKEGKAYFHNMLGVTKRGVNSKPGVYLFINKITGEGYVGSSGALASRINDDYLRKGKILGKRPIELAIKKYGLSNFKLEVYVLSQELLNKICPELYSSLTSVEQLEEISPKSLIKEGGVEVDILNLSEGFAKKEIRNLVLVMEQIFILLLNPEYNKLKVAGSAAGNKIQKELMLPVFEKTRKITYLYDAEKKELIFQAKSRTLLSEALGLKRRLIPKQLYLNRFFISDELLSEKEYSNNLLSSKALTAFINEIRGQIMEKSSRNFLPYFLPTSDLISSYFKYQPFFICTGKFDEVVSRSNIINYKLGTRYISYLTKKRVSLNPFFVTGFTDAEGSFMLILRKKAVVNVGWSVEPVFQIKLHIRDLPLLESMQSFFDGKGVISKDGKNAVCFRVSSLKQILNLIVPHFDKYPLISQKQADYLLWREVIMIIERREHLTIPGLQAIMNRRAALNLGLTPLLKEAFPHTKPVPRPLVKNTEIKNPEWLSGFVSGDGSFSVKLRRLSSFKVGFQVVLVLQITQNERDEELMKTIISYLGSGVLERIPSNSILNVKVSSFSFIYEKILPLFRKHPILGVKSADFNDWVKVAELIKDNKHRTPEGLDEICKIKEGMNKGRLIERYKEVVLPADEKLSKSTELINTVTKEEKVFPSLNAVALYLRELNPEYKASAGSLHNIMKRGGLYKGLFLVRYLVKNQDKKE